ncbi:MAG: MFS transporter [Gammaproteobacteria bacterium]|nr:MFS transporter [Gammaproteobacteria bacterium]
MGEIIKVGPIQLADGVQKFNFWTFMYAAFVCVGMLAGMNFLQGYVITVNLNVPLGQQGAVTGDLAFWTEMVAIFLIVPFGILSDRIGRKPVMIFGILMLAAGYALFPFAEDVQQLIVFRIIFAVGAAALSALIAIVGNDYTEDVSRGRLFGIAGVMNGFGVIFMSVVVAGIPAILVSRGWDSVTAGIVMFLFAAGLCAVSGLIFFFGLRSGTPAQPSARPPMRILMTSGLRAAANPRVALAYGAAFAGRSDNAIKGLFISLWAIQVAAVTNIETAEALAGAGRLMGIMGLVILLWMPLFGLILDRVNRVTGMAVAMGLAGLGYLSMGLIDNPLEAKYIPLFILLAIGQGSAILASVTLVGQESNEEERGTVVATSGLFGAIGILVAAVIGGRLFDSIGPSAPFVFVGAFQFLLCVAAVLVRIFSARNVAS